MSTEPVRTAIIGLVTTALALLVAFGVDFSTEQTAAIVAFVVAALGVGELVRSKVAPAE